MISKGRYSVNLLCNIFFTDKYSHYPLIYFIFPVYFIDLHIGRILGHYLTHKFRSSCFFTMIKWSTIWLHHLFPIEDYCNIHRVFRYYVKIIYFLGRIFTSSKLNAINDLQKNSRNVVLIVINVNSTNSQCMLLWNCTELICAWLTLSLWGKVC